MPPFGGRVSSLRAVVVSRPPDFYIDCMKFLSLLLVVALGAFPLRTQPRSLTALTIARVKYAGGGDWYNDPSAEVNLLRFIAAHTAIDVNPQYEYVDISSDKLFAYPLLFLTGHGNIAFTDFEAQRLRAYLTRGGFLYADDDYGMDRSFRREMKKVFPEGEFVELPFTHALFSTPFAFPNGVPKTHEHDNKPPRGLGLFYAGRLVLFYTVESNPSDGWADAEIHGDPPAPRTEALRFGTNIVVWALSH